MEFKFDCVQSLGCDQNGFAILEGSYQNHIVPGYILFVKEILNSMGEASSRAQQLNTTITSAHKFFISNHRIFIKAEQNKVLGFIKVGNKKLFLRDRNFNYHEVNTLCVLDFYVHESTQRRGIGKQLFDYMLKFEKKIPTELAYDRPSDKLLSFLNKYFGLNNYIPQNNNYVVFDEFFDLISNTNNNITYDNDTNRAINRLNNYNTLRNNNNYRDIENNKNYEMQNLRSKENDFINNRNIRGNNNMNMNYDNQNNNINNNIYPNDNNLRYNNNNQNNINENNMNNNNDFNPNFNRTSPPNMNMNNNMINQNNNRTSMSQVGEKLIYNNSFSNNVINKEVYKYPSTGFQNYYLNNDASTAYDNIYSKQKINLINDYLSSKKQTEDEYIAEQYGLKENNINNSNGRLNDLMNKISDITTENRLNGADLFNKRNQYATLFDDKKLAEYSYNRQQNLKNIGGNNLITENDFQNYQMNRVINGKKSPQRLQHYTPFSRLGKVYTTILPTSSSAYGACYHNNEINNKEQSPNRLYY